mgnify:CR=1 FL=1
MAVLKILDELGLMFQKAVGPAVYPKYTIQKNSTQPTLRGVRAFRNYSASVSSSSSGSSSMVNTAFFSLPQPWAFKPDLYGSPAR